MPNRPPKPVLAKQRSLVNKAVIEFLRHANGLYFRSGSAIKNIEEITVGAAIYIGQLDGKLMTASDIAHYIGLPRPSVVRKLRHLATVRKLETIRIGQRVCYFFPDINDAAVLASFHQRAQILRKLCTELSKLDTPSLAQIQANKIHP